MCYTSKVVILDQMSDMDLCLAVFSKQEARVDHITAYVDKDQIAVHQVRDNYSKLIWKWQIRGTIFESGQMTVRIY